MSKANCKLTRRTVTDPRDITTWSVARILGWLMSCEAHYQARRTIRRFRPNTAGDCTCNTCVSRLSTSSNGSVR